MNVASHRLLALSLVLIAFGCSKSGSAEGGAASASANAAASAVPKAAPSAAAPAASAEITCTTFASLDSAIPKRQPLQTSVKGARFPNGGSVKVQKPELYSIGYFQKDKVATACTIRKQLEDDKWTIDSMKGAGTTESPVIILAKKGANAIQVMVGPGDVPDITTSAFLTAK